MTELVLHQSHDSHMVVVVWRAPSRDKLRAMIREANPGHIDTGSGADCTGRVCGRYAKAIRHYRIDNEWVAIVQLQVAYDV